MNRRSLIQAFLATALLMAGNAHAQQMGRDYVQLSPPQTGGAGGQIEVVEFFSYGCPHCANFEPRLSKWVASLDKDVKFIRVPVSFNRNWVALGRLYYTLEAMGLGEKLSMPVFDAIHKNYIRLDDEAKRNEWLAKMGVDVKKFNDTWRSFGVESQMKRATQLAEAYKVQSVPVLYIDGKFMVSNRDEKLTEDQAHAKNIETANALVAQVRASKKK